MFPTVDATVFSSSPTSETDSSGKPRYQGRILIPMVFLFGGIYMKADLSCIKISLFGYLKAKTPFDSLSLQCQMKGL